MKKKILRLLILLLVFPVLASAREVTYTEYTNGTVLASGDTLLISDGPDSFNFDGITYIKYPGINKYYNTSYGYKWDCDEYFSYNQEKTICINDYTLFSDMTIDDLVVEHLIEKIDVPYGYAPGGSEVPIVMSYDGYGMKHDFDVDIDCDKTELELGEKATCRFNLAYSVFIPQYGGFTSSYMTGNGTSHIKFNTVGDEVTFDNFTKNPVLTDEQTSYDYSYKVTFSEDYNTYCSNFYVNGEESLFYWYNPGSTNYEDPDPVNGRTGNRNGPYGIEAYIGEFEVTPFRAEGIVREGSENRTLDYDAKLNFEFNLFDTQGNVDYVFTKGFKLKNYITERAPETDPEEPEDPVVDEPDETPEVKDAEENPKTGLPNYMYLILPMALLAGAYLVINKVTVFKNMK